MLDRDTQLPVAPAAADRIGAAQLLPVEVAAQCEVLAGRKPVALFELNWHLERNREDFVGFCTNVADAERVKPYRHLK
jgi:hypothetical protein